MLIFLPQIGFIMPLYAPPLLRQRYFSGIFIWLAALCMPALVQAQQSQCGILGALNQIERAVDADPQAGQAQISAMRRTRAEVVVATQIFTRNNWMASFLASRERVLRLYLSGKLDTARRAQQAASYKKLAAELQTLSRIIPCAAGDSNTAGPESQNTEGHKNTTEIASQYRDAPRGTASNFAQFVARISRFLSENTAKIMPYLFFSATFIGLWAYMKYDEYRIRLRQRFLCHVDVVLVGKRQSQKAYMTDISRLGVGLHLKHSPPPKTKLTLHHGDWSAEIRITRVNGVSAGARFAKRLKEIPDEYKRTGPKKWVPSKDYKQTAGK